jgi:hypothetical protein
VRLGHPVLGTVGKIVGVADATRIHGVDMGNGKVGNGRPWRGYCPIGGPGQRRWWENERVRRDGMQVQVRQTTEPPSKPSLDFSSRSILGCQYRLKAECLLVYILGIRAKQMLGWFQRRNDVFAQKVEHRIVLS